MSDYYITEGEICDKMFNLDITGVRISFTLDGIDEKDREWYCNRITAALRIVDDNATLIERTRVQGELQKALGL